MNLLTFKMFFKWTCCICMFMQLIILSVPSVSSFQKDVHLLMTKEEKLTVFGSDDTIPKYEIIEPRKLSGGRYRRHLNYDNDISDENLVISFDTSDKKLQLYLQRQENIASPTLKLQILDDNINEAAPVTLSHPNCYYRGFVTNIQNSAAVISTCTPGEIKGFVHLSPNDHYIIAPLPRRIRREASNASISSNHVFFQPNKRSACPTHHFNDLEFDIEEENIHPRTKRQGGHVKTVETAVIVDDVLYSLWKKEYPEDPENAIIDMVFTLLCGVQLLYEQPSLTDKVKFVLVHLTIIKSPKAGPSKGGGEIFAYLQAFSDWQANMNPTGDHNEDHWDHAIMLTGLDLYNEDPESKSVIGMAWYAAMCSPVKSSTINEGRNFNAVYVISHEIGHNLGMQHDGTKNDCPSETFIMSPSTGPGKVSWSTCSDNYLERFLNRRSLKCLDDSDYVENNLDFRSTKLPGEKYSSNTQCQLNLGNGYKACKSKDKPFENICRELWCYDGTMASYAHPALDGTLCSYSKMCYRGECLPKQEVLEMVKYSNTFTNHV